MNLICCIQNQKNIYNALLLYNILITIRLHPWFKSMQAKFRIVTVLIFALITLIYSVPVRSSDFSGRTHFVYVLCDDWHCELLIAYHHFKNSSILANIDLLPGYMVQAGWGEQDYYMKKNPDSWDALKAALWPTNGVLHIRMIYEKEDSALRHLHHYRIFRIRMNGKEIQNLVNFIEESFYLDESGKPLYLAPGWWPGSSFYMSSKDYFLPRTCNTWTASALQKGGVDIRPLLYMNSSSLVKKLSEIEIEDNL